MLIKLKNTTRKDLLTARITNKNKKSRLLIAIFNIFVGIHLRVVQIFYQSLLFPSKIFVDRIFKEIIQSG